MAFASFCLALLVVIMMKVIVVVAAACGVFQYPVVNNAVLLRTTSSLDLSD